MKYSPYLQAEREYVERTLADSVICDRCRATLKTFADACTADLADLCPGFMAIEQAKLEFTVKVAGRKA